MSDFTVLLETNADEGRIYRVRAASAGLAKAYAQHVANAHDGVDESRWDLVAVFEGTPVIAMRANWYREIDLRPPAAQEVGKGPGC